MRECSMTRRVLLFVLCLAVVLTACVPKPVYVRKYEPVTRADTLALHADSVAWAAEIRAKENNQRITNVLVYVGSLIVFSLLIAAVQGR